MSYESSFSLDDFQLYNQAREFRKSVYKVIKQLPPEEKYCLGTQMRRAALSVSNNIAEGHGRWHYQENMQFCRISRGSVGEIIDDLNACLDEGYATEELTQFLKSKASELNARINSYIAYLRKSKQGKEPEDGL